MPEPNFNIFNIREVCESELEKCAEIIRKSFATVAADFNFTPEKNPNHRAFIKTERLVHDRKSGIMQFGLFAEDMLAGFMALEKIDTDIYKLEMLSVLPEFRHNGYGGAFIDFAKCKVKELGGKKITISIIDEHEVLKKWYMLNGFVHTGSEKFPHIPFTVGYMEVEV